MDNFDEIKALISNRICGVCDQQPQQVCVSNVGGNVVYGMRCNCGVDKASLVKPTSYARHRRERMEDAETEQDIDVEGLF